jgi:iron complex transport system substrate-binding protein
MKRTILFVCLALGVVACGEAEEPVPERPSPTAQASAAPQTVTRTVTDMIGRTLSLPEQVMTVAALSPSAADFATALGLQVVGRSSDTAAAAAPSASATGSALSPDFNAVAALAPDLVIGDAAYHSGRTRDFDQFGFPVFVVKANTYDEVLLALDALGAATGRVDEAKAARDEVVATAETAIGAASVRGAGSPPPRVLILTGGGRDVFGGGGASYLGSMVSSLGATNVLETSVEGGPVPGFGVVDVGQSASLAPDVVLILSSGEGGLAARIKGHPSWAGTPAVRSGSVYEVDTALYLRAAGPRVGEAMEGLVPLLWR